jgi:diaminopropionate ammonia-lyase
VNSLEFHRSLPGYAPTPLHDLPDLARELGVRRALVKDETDRFGLGAFKALGASWAAHVMLERLGPRTLVTASAGNHGTALAWYAGIAEVPCVIVLPARTPPQRVAIIEGFGARVEIVDGTYEEAVEVADRIGAQPGHLLVQDVAYPGYEEIPPLIVDGYATLMREIADARPELVPHSGTGTGLGVLVVPVGVGSLATAVVRAAREWNVRVLAVEPDHAAPLAASLAAGEWREVPADQPSAMTGLNCGRLSTQAWPELRSTIERSVTVTERRAGEHVETLYRHGIPAGPSGAATLEAAEHLGEDDDVLFIVTERLTT